MSDIKQIEKDVLRTGYLIEIGEDETKKYDLDRQSLSLKNMLITFSAFHQATSDEIKLNKLDLGYTQGLVVLTSYNFKIISFLFFTE